MASKTREGVYLAWALVGAALVAFGYYQLRRDAGGGNAWVNHDVVGGVRYGADGKPYDATMDWWA